MKNVILSLMWLVISQAAAFAQFEMPAETPTIHIHRTGQKILIDGELNDAVWQEQERAGTFWQYFPMDSSSAKGQTELRMTYDDQFLYVGIRCETTGDEFVVSSLKRDYSFSAADNITLVFDTYSDQNNAFVFGMNPYGVQREALIANGGRIRNDFVSSWDNKWYGEAVKHPGYWTAEFAIPFKTLRFKEGSTEWRFNCYRNDTQHNEWSTWHPIPRNFLTMDLGFMGRIVWDEPLRKPGANISVIPYVNVGMARDFEDPTEQRPDWNLGIGGDAKVALSSALNLDLTVNPDFSQVEVDQQVTNLDRFEVFFPERRQFFLENADLFGSFGQTRNNPFFSRRIGIAVDTSTGLNVLNPIYYGARLSGKLHERLRVGLLNMQSAPLEQSGLPSFNYTVAALQQQVYSRSNLSFIFVNKSAVNKDDYQGDFSAFNRVAGLEYRLATPDNRWKGKFYYHRAFTPDKQDHQFAQGGQIEYQRRRYRLEWAHNVVGNGFDAEVGFVPRRDYILMSPEFQLFFFPKSGIFNQHSINVDTRFFLQIGKDGNTIIPEYGLSERQTEISWEFQFKNNTRGTINLQEDDLTLLADFDPTRLQEDGVVLPAGSDYHFFSLNGEYTSDQRKKIFYTLEPNIGQFYNGFIAGMGGSLNFRYQPYGAIALNYSYNYVELDAPFRPASIWLVGPRIDLTFSKKVFLTTFIQYNNQLDNLNINARFQWRFQPVSDFFLVYTDNYLTDPRQPFGVRNRSLVAKVTYWLNL
ncbi:DUF5916 domain-containing protein [Flavilitoribacter nigricans]|uniref:DUF5916 domain-containing protein n=1 Tax=Flavilitoribacter nigricans (strain ATCC 23147 / DSM 23189 / NBRC 102662 / NCIMB 1420 / SS-2) TaxID=1122177 RepID=A0A2D0N026_FLAN2|nr:DUF5916 domain-containing protein [Flavilitoribacter nigricans]PHN01726.1 hypothetical protein CRP01_35870 [Flavilitoribacter nigricans DSM 23189 = NBRC 102662]